MSWRRRKTLNGPTSGSTNACAASCCSCWGRLVLLFDAAQAFHVFKQYSCCRVLQMVSRRWEKQWEKDSRAAVDDASGNISLLVVFFVLAVADEGVEEKIFWC